MPTPSQLPQWASDTLYTGGVEDGTSTKVEPTSGRKAEGWEPAAKPPAQEFNWWMNLVYQWFTWYYTENQVLVLTAPGWRLPGGNSANFADGQVVISDLMGLHRTIELPSGTVISQVVFDIKGDGGSTADVTVALERVNSDGTTDVIETTVFSNCSGASFNPYTLTVSPAVQFAEDGWQLYVTANATGTLLANTTITYKRTNL